MSGSPGANGTVFLCDTKNNSICQSGNGECRKVINFFKKGADKDTCESEKQKHDLIKNAVEHDEKKKQLVKKYFLLSDDNDCVKHDTDGMLNQLAKDFNINPEDYSGLMYQCTCPDNALTLATHIKKLINHKVRELQ